MATYTNLASLTNVQVGDVVTYTQDTAIDTQGCRIKVELYGKKPSGGANGGYTVFDLDTMNLDHHFYYTLSYGSSLMYDKTQSSTSRTAYYRIGVAGDAGKYSTGGKGGGPTGGSGSRGNGSQNTYANGGQGGTQTAGGAGGSGYGSSYSYKSGSSGTAGGFGNTNGDAGTGWYTGGTGAYVSAGYSSSYIQTSASGGAGGGSGFVIGQSTTTYPSGYMGGSSTDIAALEAAVSNATLTQGGSTETADKMVITILALGTPVLSSIAVTKMPTKTTYYVGDTFSSSGMVVTATYSNSSTANVTSSCTLSTPNMSTAGTKTITVSYTDGGITKTTTFNITVTAVVGTSLTLSGNYPTTFTIGDTFSYTGLVVTENFNNGSSSVISSGYTVSSPDMSTLGTKTVTVSYDSLSATYSITVKNALTSITITSQPDKTTYLLGETFDPTGLAVSATYADGTTTALTSSQYTLSTPDMSVVGQKAITVSFTDDGITQTTGFSITVIRTSRVGIYNGSQFVPAYVNYYTSDAITYTAVNRGKKAMISGWGDIDWDIGNDIKPANYRCFEARADADEWYPDSNSATYQKIAGDWTWNITEPGIYAVAYLNECTCQLDVGFLLNDAHISIVDVNTIPTIETAFTDITQVFSSGVQYKIIKVSSVSTSLTVSFRISSERERASSSDPWPGNLIGFFLSSLRKITIPYSFKRCEAYRCTSFYHHLDVPIGGLSRTTFRMLSDPAAYSSYQRINLLSNSIEDNISTALRKVNISTTEITGGDSLTAGSGTVSSGQYGHYYWSDGTDLYYSDGSKQMRLVRSTFEASYDFEWENMTWTGLTNFSGNDIWTDGTNIYCSDYANGHYILNISTKTWRQVSFDYEYYNAGGTPDFQNIPFNGSDIWYDGTDAYLLYTYYPNGNQSAGVDIGGKLRVVPVGTGYGQHGIFTGSRMSSASGGNLAQDVWTDGTNLYKSLESSGNYVWDSTNLVWNPVAFTGVTNFSGREIFSDGTNIYLDIYEGNVGEATSTFYILDKTNRSWSQITSDLIFYEPYGAIWYINTHEAPIWVRIDTDIEPPVETYRIITASSFENKDWKWYREWYSSGIPAPSNYSADYSDTSSNEEGGVYDFYADEDNLDHWSYDEDDDDWGANVSVIYSNLSASKSYAIAVRYSPEEAYSGSINFRHQNNTPITGADISTNTAKLAQYGLTWAKEFNDSATNLSADKKYKVYEFTNLTYLKVHAVMYVEAEDKENAEEDIWISTLREAL